MTQRKYLSHVFYIILGSLTLVGFQNFTPAKYDDASSYQGIGKLPGKSIIYYSPANKSRLFLNTPEDFLRTVRKQPIDGLTFSVATAYQTLSSTEISTKFRDITSRINTLKENKDVWLKNSNGERLVKMMYPLSHMSRLVGGCKGSNSIDMNGKQNTVVGRDNIDCFDIQVNDPDLNAFFRELREGLRFSKTTGSRGIFIDHEAYVNYSAVQLGNLIKHYQYKDGFANRETARNHILKRLRSIGFNLADTINSIFPESEVWVLSLKMKAGFSPTISNEKIVAMDFTDTANITGIIFYHALSRAISLNYKFKLIEGGENYIWYPKYSRGYSTRKFREQESLFKSLRLTFGPRLQLGAPITFWNDFLSDYSQQDNFKIRMGDEPLEARYLSNLSNIFYDHIAKRNYIWIYPKMSGAHAYEIGCVTETSCRSVNLDFSDRVSLLIQQIKRNYHLNQ